MGMKWTLCLVVYTLCEPAELCTFKCFWCFQRFLTNIFGFIRIGLPLMTDYIGCANQTKRYIGCYGWNGWKQIQVFFVVFLSRRSFVVICNSIWLPAGGVLTKLNGGDGCNGC